MFIKSKLFLSWNLKHSFNTFLKRTCLINIMFQDVVFPNNNELEFLNLSKKLDISKIIFCCPFGKKSNPESFEFSSNSGEIKKAPLASPMLSLSAGRDIFEMQKPLFIFGLEEMSRNDSMHSRQSGFNHILAELAHKNNHTICLSHCSLLNSGAENFSIVLGRMMQNVRLCRKYKVRMKLASFAKSPYQMRAAKEMGSFGHFLGMQQDEIKRALLLNFD